MAVLQDRDIIVFCHLRWNFVFQRPQHIISRFAKNRKILFVEEPLQQDSKENDAALIQPTENLTIVQPNISWPMNAQELAQITNKYAKQQKLNNPILWFYSASFQEVIEHIPHALIVYDCMDELAAFKGASADLIEKEKELLKKADIVFTGGKSLYESKKQHHANVHCFPSSVDREHFEKTMSSQTHIPDDLQNAVHPTIGFYGVIDERIDLELLDQIAEKLPTYTFIMIGPIVKIDPNSLPKRANIVYPGGKKYEELPNYLKGIDIAMMPFALNKSTQFISPTKTLEYMAAHKPIVSTPIYDVVRDYKDVVKIAGNADEFAKAIEQFVYESQQDMAQREEKEKKILTETSWDKTVTAMSDLMHKELEKKGKEIPINTQKAPLTDYFKVL